MNIIRYLFIFNAVFIGGLGLFINYIESYLPVWLTRTYRYGKVSAKVHHRIVAKWELPKKWFAHLYIFAGPILTVILCFIIYKYFYNEKVPEIVLTLLDTLFGASRKPLVPAANVIIAIILYNAQVWKRLYESTYVSVFSNQKINVVHYLLGYVHYSGTILCFLGESEGFTRDSLSNRPWTPLTTMTFIFAFIFLWASYMQLQSNCILANLRKNKDGTVMTYSHNIPFDGLFEYISNPLQFTEILMYFMLSLILWQASTYHYVTFWVMVNQIESAYLCHQWYHNTFKNYPKKRKILIPCVW